MQLHDIEKTSSGLVAVPKFIKELGIAPSTLWRWRKRGWIADPVDIAGRKYLTTEAIMEFRRRAKSGDFKAPNQPPTAITHS